MQPEEIKIEDPFAENAPLDGMDLSLPALPVWATVAASDIRHASPTAHYGNEQPQTLTGGDLDGPTRLMNLYEMDLDDSKPSLRPDTTNCDEVPRFAKKPAKPAGPGRTMGPYQPAPTAKASKRIRKSLGPIKGSRRGRKQLRRAIPSYLLPKKPSGKSLKVTRWSVEFIKTLDDLLDDLEDPYSVKNYLKPIISDRVSRENEDGGCDPSRKGALLEDLHKAQERFAQLP